MAEANAWASLGLSPVTAPPTSAAPAPASGGGFDDLISATATKYNVDPNYIRASIKVESSGNPNAFNAESGAAGLAQAIPDTARRYGIDPKNPAQSIDLIGKMTRESLDRHKAKGRTDDPYAYASNEYHGGTSEKNWGPRTADRTQKVQAAMGGAKAGGDAWASLGLTPVTAGAGGDDDRSVRPVFDYGPATPKSGGKETGVLAAAGRGITHGAIGLAEAVNLAGQFLAGRVGAQGMQEFFKHGAEWWAQTGKGYEMPAELQGNILDKPELLGKGAWWAYSVADMIPSLASTMVPALGTYSAMIQGPAAIARLARIGAAVTGGAIGGAQEGLQTYKTVLERGGSDGEAAVAGTLMGLASAGLNAISLNVFMGKSTAPLKKFLLSGATESLTEWAEEPTEGAILSGTSVARPEDNPVSRLREGINVVPPSFLLGGLGGLGAGQTRTAAGGAEQPPAADPSAQAGLGVNGAGGAQPGATPGTPPAAAPSSSLPATVLVTGLPSAPVAAPTGETSLFDVSQVPGMEPAVFPTDAPAESLGGLGVNPPTPPVEPMGGLPGTPPPIAAPPPDIGNPISPPAPEASSADPAPDTEMRFSFPAPPVDPEPETPVSVPEQSAVQTDPNAVQSSPNPEPAPSVTRPVDRRRQRAEEARRLNTDRDDLLTAIAKLGGIDWKQAHSEWGLDPADWKKAPRPVFGMPVFRQSNGRLLDDMAEALHEAGYIDEATPNALFDALDRHIGGQPVYTGRGYENYAQRLRDEMDAEAMADGDSIEIDQELVDAAQDGLRDEVTPEDEALMSVTAVNVLDTYRDTLGEAVIEDIYERAAIEAADGTDADFEAAVLRLIEEYTDGAEDSRGEPAQGEGGEAGRGVEGDAASSAEAAAAETAEPAGEPEETAEVAPPPDPEPEPAPQAPAPAPAGVVASGAGLFALTGQTEAEANAEAVMREREQAARRRRENAPPPENFMLAGSNRPSDVAAGQGAQNIPGLIDPEPAAAPAAPSEPAESAGPNAERGRALLREMVVEVDAVDEDSGEAVKAKLPALEALEENATQLEKAKGLLECLSL